MHHDLFGMDYTSPSFDIQHIDRYALLVQAGTKDHVLAVVDDKAHLLLLTTFDLDRLHSQAADVLEAPFSKVRVVCRQNAFTFVPDEVYDEQYLGQYAASIAHGLGAERVAVTPIPAIGVRQVHAVEPFAYHRFADRFPAAMFVPETSVLLEVAGGRLAKKQSAYLGIDVWGTRLALYCFKQGHFLFCNTFEMGDENDFNYHVLHTVQTLNLPWENLRCLLSGQIDEHDAYFRVLRKYTDQLEFAETARLSRTVLPSELEQYQHRYLALMGLNTCEL